MNVMVPTLETEILTKSQPIMSPAQPATRVLSPAAGELITYVIDVLDYCVDHRMAVPLPVRHMLHCVNYALDTGDDDYIQSVHRDFEIVAQGEVYGESVYEQETAICEACGTRFVIADGYYEKDDPEQHIVGYAYCKECCHW